MQTLLDEGLPAAEVAGRAVEALSGCLVVSDAPSADQKWLDTLAEAANVALIVTVRHYYEALNVACRRLTTSATAEASGQLSSGLLGKDVAKPNRNEGSFWGANFWPAAIPCTG